MEQWEYKAVFLKVFPQARDTAPKPGKVSVAIPAAIEPLIAGQEVKLLAEYLDMQAAKGWELFSVVPDARGDRGTCFIFRKPPAASAAAGDTTQKVQVVQSAPTPVAAASTAAAPAQTGAPGSAAPPAGLPLPAASSVPLPAAAPHAPVPAPPPTRASGVQLMPPAAAAPPRTGSSPQLTPPPGVTNVVMPSTATPGTLLVPPTGAAPQGPAPLPAQPAAPAPLPARLGAAMGIPARPPGAPAPMAIQGSGPPVPAGPTPEEVAEQQKAQDEVAAVLYAIEAAARGNPQGWADSTFIAKVCAQSSIEADRMYELLEYLETNRYIEWSPASQEPKRGGWVRRAR